MTQEQFNQMMNVWISQQAAKEPGEWSAEASAWAALGGALVGAVKNPWWLLWQLKLVVDSKSSTKPSPLLKIQTNTE